MSRKPLHVTQEIFDQIGAICAEQGRSKFYITNAIMEHALSSEEFVSEALHKAASEAELDSIGKWIMTISDEELEELISERANYQRVMSRSN